MPLIHSLLTFFRGLLFEGRVEETYVVAGRISDLVTIESGLTQRWEKFICNTHYCSMLTRRALDLMVSHILV